MILRRFLAALALLPTPALADFDCTLVEECSKTGCLPFPGGPLLLRDQGERWTITLDDTALTGVALSGADGPALDMVTLAVPYQDDMSGWISIYPTGELTFTVHARTLTVGSVTFNGTCKAVSG
jgi:hypothetical protein